MVLGLVLVVLLLGLRQRRSGKAFDNRRVTSAYPPVSTSDEALKAFFLDPFNYANQPEERIFAVMGKPTDYDD